MINRRLPIVALLCTGLALAPMAHAQHRHGGHAGGYHGHGGWHGGDHHGGGGAGAAILGGMIGLGLGAAIAGSSQPYYGPPAPYYPAPGYYPPPAPSYYYPPQASGYYAPPPAYAPPAGSGAAEDLNRQELYRMQMTPYSR